MSKNTNASQPKKVGKVVGVVNHITHIRGTILVLISRPFQGHTCFQKSLKLIKYCPSYDVHIAPLGGNKHKLKFEQKYVCYLNL